MRALVLALNPSIDVEWRVPRVRWEEKNQILYERRWPGGKGVNVARWLRHLGGDPRLLLPLGETTGRELAAGLRRERLRAAVVPLREATRVNIIVTTEEQGQLRFNPLGPELSPGEWRSVLRTTAHELRRGAILILSGSLPRGVPADAYAQLIALGQRAGVRALLDCDGTALSEAVRARPFLVKPNIDELGRWHGQPLRSLAAIRRTALKMSRQTGSYVLVSLGARGALLLNHERRLAVRATAPRVRALNTVGAGDALLAGVAAGIVSGDAVDDWLRKGVGAGTAAVSCPAGELAAGTVVRRFARCVRLHQ